ncbi:MAG: GntR family transcriptional regulator [Rhodospirillales bacterium]|nr:GntR family transcriptional regulator [Rhodospirillales bacterium]
MIPAIAPAPSLARQVYETIRDAICVGDLLPGTRVAEDALARQLNVSRQPIHQALGQLRQEGFLCESGRRGLEVAPISAALVEQVYDLRLALEPHAAARAAQRAATADRDEGEARLEAGRRAVAARDVAAVIEADFAFHRYLYRLSDNPLVEATATMNWHHVRRVVRALMLQAPDFNPRWQEHGEILDAVLRGDAPAASRLAHAHVEIAIRSLRGRAADCASAPAVPSDG